MSQLLRVAWYRFRVGFVRQVGGYLSVVLLIGLIGGLAMASIAGARRTQSSYPTFLASTDPSNIVFSPNQGAVNSAAVPDVRLKSTIERLPGVKHVVSAVSPSFLPITAKGVPITRNAQNVLVISSLDGMLSKQDRITIVKGRAANPAKSTEVVMDAAAAKLYGVRVGRQFFLGFYTNAQFNEPGFGTAAVMPALRVRVKVVGIMVFNNQVFEDDIDKATGIVVLTPALARRAITITKAAALPVLFGLKLQHGNRDVTKVEHEVIAVLPPGSTYEFHVTSHVVSQVELAMKPESFALGAFGLIAALVALVLGAQAISRQLKRGSGDREVMRALGASPANTIIDGLIGVFCAVVLGALLAFAVALALSPLSPLGPVRAVYPNPGFTVDWTVLGLGFLLMVVALGSVATVQSIREVSRRVARRRQVPLRRSAVTRGLEAAGIPVAGVVGVHFALEPGRGRTSVPVRSVLVGSALAVALVVATVTFASGFNTLVSHPALYGWNWNYMLNPSNDVPPIALSLLSHDPMVAAWSGDVVNILQIDGQQVPMMIGSSRPKVAPPITSGHGLRAKNQIVLGATTMALLHKHVGDTVVVTYGTAKDAPVYVPPTTLTIVGVATFPTVGYTSFVLDHTSMGTGALLSSAIEPPAFQKILLSPDPNLNGPEMVIVRMKRGVSAVAGRADMQRIANASNKVLATDPHASFDNVVVEGVLRPVQIVNYRSNGSTPIILSLGLALGAILALGLTLSASVRRRRRDLALLKTLGFTQRQLAAAVAWQATVAAVIGIVVGIPVGVVVGRELWTLFARNIDAVPYATVPVLSVVLIGVGTLLFANLVAIYPGRSAARTPPALALRAE
ncbi:MAG TPA: FtsX-like permease family protein [Acidimicrobiales bacterium]|jgi:hypothetical protein|nr:FtsX-like permease family protein [Acidimicrobiales bacterium]